MRCIDAWGVADDQGVTPPLYLVVMVTLPSSSHSWSHPLPPWLSHMNTHSHTCAAFSKISVWGLILRKLHKRRKSFLHETKFVMLPENWTCKYIIYCRQRQRCDNFWNEFFSQNQFILHILQIKLFPRHNIWSIDDYLF